MTEGEGSTFNKLNASLTCVGTAAYHDRPVSASSVLGGRATWCGPDKRATGNKHISNDDTRAHDPFGLDSLAFLMVVMTEDGVV